MTFNIRNKVSQLFLFLQPGIVFSMLVSCANIQPPLGGPRDTIPPVLLKASPVENTVLFKGNKITLQFNEYIKLENLNENLIINPPAEKFPNIEGKLRNVTVKLKDTLQPNTTYTINFGNAIRDINEGNPFKNFSYSFSTGPHIDSLGLAGKVILAETGLPDSSLIVLLHTNDDDSAVAKEKPRFVTRLNGKGEFHFDHLPEGSFNIFALKDEGTKRYTSNEILFAFFDRQVKTLPEDSIIELRAFAGEKAPEKKTSLATVSKTKDKDDKKLQYSLSVQGGPQDLQSPLFINFANAITDFDPGKIRLTDTLYNLVSGYILEKDTSGTAIEIRLGWPEKTNYRLLLGKGFATDSSGSTVSRSDTVSFETKSETDYGSVKVKFTGIDINKHPVLQWVQGDKVVQSAALVSGEYNAKLFMPGQYRVRVLYDANGNSIWDTGNYWKKTQPEQVIAIDQTFNVKANWDNEFEIRL